MFGISGEHLLVLGIVLLIFGPRRLPELGNTMGKAIRNFKDAISGVEEAKYRHLEEKEKPAASPASKVEAQVVDAQVASSKDPSTSNNSNNS
jgi:sec-independent protein translocase protein TatA